MRKSTNPPLPSLSASVLVVRQYADSFEGLTIKEAKERLSSGRIKMSVWKRGKQLVATFRRHEVGVFFFNGTAMIASVQVISKDWAGN